MTQHTLAIYPDKERGYVVAPMLSDCHKADKRAVARMKRNISARARNEVLRDICGTSARAAREDMGL